MVSCILRSHSLIVLSPHAEAGSWPLAEKTEHHTELGGRFLSSSHVKDSIISLRDRKSKMRVKRSGMQMGNGLVKEKHYE